MPCQVDLFGRCVLHFCRESTRLQTFTNSSSVRGPKKLSQAFIAPLLLILWCRLFHWDAEVLAVSCARVKWTGSGMQIGFLTSGVTQLRATVLKLFPPPPHLLLGTVIFNGAREKVEILHPSPHLLPWICGGHLGWCVSGMDPFLFAGLYGLACVWCGDHPLNCSRL